jgi:hypothetical protein
VPTRKQRRRREKERRHEWEEVYVDETGREIAPDEIDDIRPEPRGRENGRRAPAARQRRPVDPPSWRRVAKRALVFAPFMFIVITVLDPKTSLAAHVLYTVQLILLFVPFSYLVDTVAYRVHRKRVEQAASARSTRS